LEPLKLQITPEHIADFRKVVLNHITHQLPSEEWIWLRSRASEQVAGVMPRPEVDLDATPAQLVAENVYEDTFRAGDVLKVFAGRGRHPEVIGHIAGQPVHYLHSTGIYLWGPAEGSNSISFWISYPSYPPGW
jgi:hypothetical protein